MTFLMDILKGIMIGIANIIPGVSGGTMAVSLGIYDKLISSISGFLKNKKKSFMILLPIVMGCAIGIVAFSYLVEYLLSHYTFITVMAFIGLILGGLPLLFSSLKSSLRKEHRKLSAIDIFIFILLIAVSILLPMLKGQEETLTVLTATPVSMILLFVIGVIASATMVIPGVSGSMVLMILGYYYGILNTIKSFIEALKSMNISQLLSTIMVLVPFGIGVIIGIVLIAKLIEYLFEKHSVSTYCGILGLVVSSPIAILYNTGLFGQADSLNPVTIIAGIVCCVLGFILTYFIGEKG